MPRWATCDACGESYSVPSGAPDVPADERLCPECEELVSSASPTQGGLRSSASEAPKASTARPPAPPADRSKGAKPPAAGASKPPAPAPAEAPAANRTRPKSAGVDQPLDRATKIGAAIAGVLTVLAIVVVVVIRGRKADEQARFEEQERRLDAFAAEIRGYDLGVEADCTKAIQRAEAMTSLWKSTRIAGEVTDIVTRSRTAAESLKERRELLARLEAVEETLKDPGALSSDRLEEAKRKLDDLESRASVVGAEFLARLGVARASIGRVFATKLREEAEQFAAANPDKGRAALAKFTRAEDEVLRSYERAIAEKNKDDETFFRDGYQACMKKSDELGAATFTPEVIEKTAWKDLLRGEFASQWNRAEVAGFVAQVKDGALDLVGPDASTKKMGLVTIGDRAYWRDFVIDMEFTIESGEFSTVLRLGRRTDTAENYTFTAGGDGSIQPGKTYSAEISLIGSALKVTLTPEDVPPFETEVRWVQTRKGAIGLIVPDGAKVKITRFRIRDLR